MKFGKISLSLVFLMFLVSILSAFGSTPPFNIYGNQSATGNETFTSATALSNFSNGGLGTVSLCDHSNGTGSLGNLTIGKNCAAAYIYNLSLTTSGGSPSINISCQFYASWYDDFAQNGRLFLMSRDNFTSGGTNDMFALRVITGVMTLRDEQGGSNTALTGFNMDGTRQLVKVAMRASDSGGVTAFINGTEVAKKSYAGAALTPDFVSFGTAGTLNGGVNATVDDFVCWNNSVDYNKSGGGGGGGGGGGADTTPPNFLANSSNNSAPRINYIVMFNISANDTGNFSGYTFSWDNGSGSFINNTFNFVSSGISVGNFSVNKTISNVSGTVIQYQWFVNDTSGNMASTSIFTLTVGGTTPPNLTINSNNFFSINNNTAISQSSASNVLLNFTITDDIDVFGFEFNITNASSQTIINFSNTSMGGIFANFSRFINVTAPQGYYNVSITVWDTHTLQSIPDIPVNYGIGNTITFENNIKITADSAIYTKSVKSDDRYDFEFTYLPFFVPTTKTFYVESDGDLFYRQNSIYKGHFIDFKHKKWIDFEGLSSSPIITKVSNSKYKVEFSNSDKNIVFHSIGGLNSRLYNFQYYISDPSAQWFSPTGSFTFSSGQNLSFSLNVTGNYLNQTFFYLWNSTFGLVSTTNITALFNGTYFYNTSFSGLTDIIYYINATHFTQVGSSKGSPTITISQQLLNNCTPPGIQAVNYTFKDEGNNSIITIGTVTGTYNYNVSSVYTTTYVSITNYSVCIYPNGTTIPTTYSIVYSSGTYPQRTYSGTAIFNNITQSITLYSVALSNGQFARFQIVDEFQSPIQGATGTMQFLIGGTLTIVEIETSDSSGFMTFFENPNNNYVYTFSASGYTSNTATLRITDGNIRTVVLKKQTSTIAESLGAGITYSLSPPSQTLLNNTAYDFFFNLTSQYWNITSCILYLQNTTNFLTSSSTSFNGSLCNIVINFNTGNQSSLIARAVYQLNATTNQSVINQYSVNYFYVGTFSLKTVLDDITNFGSSGFNNFGRALLALVITFLVVGGLAVEFTAFREPEPLLLIAWAFTALFSYVGWYNVPFISIPNVNIAGLTIISQVWLQQYIIFILMTLYTSGYLINKSVA